MSLGVTSDLSRIVFDAACRVLPAVRLTDIWSRHESDDDFEGTRNWAALLVMLSVPAFIAGFICLMIWLF